MPRLSGLDSARPAARLVVCCLVALCLVPSPALGQSAGDQQYADPLAGLEQGNGGGSDSRENPGSTGQGDSSATPNAAPGTPPQATAGQSAGGGGSALPRTGLDAMPLVALGLGMLAAGTIIHVGIGPTRRRRRRDPVVLFDGTLPPPR